MVIPINVYNQIDYASLKETPIFWVEKGVGYLFGFDKENKLCYWKTTDDGKTWEDKVPISKIPKFHRR